VRVKDRTLRAVIDQLFQGSGFRCTVAPEVPDVTLSLNVRDVPRESALRLIVRIVEPQCGKLKLSRLGNEYQIALEKGEIHRSPTGSLQFKGVPLRRAIEQIFSGSNRQYSVNANVPDVLVSVEFRDARLDQALRSVIESAERQAQGLTFHREENLYIVTMDGKRPPATMEAGPNRRRQPISVLAATGTGPSRRVSIHLSHAPLHQAIAAIFAGSGIGYSVGASVPDVPVSLDIRDQDVKSAVKGVVEAAAQQAPGLTVTRKGATYLIRR
jgi:hypothetical protein